MKKRVLLLTSACLLALGAQAQISIIPKGGVTLSTVSYDDEPGGQESKVGFVGGAAVEIGIVQISFPCSPNCSSSRKAKSTMRGA
jgi:hypothetical protein